MKTLEELELDLKTVTDQVGRLIDQVQQKGYVPVFRCGHSGLHLPSDYLREWGTLYGIGLGNSPVSEVLDSDYDVAPPNITPEIRRIEQIMHPVRSCSAQVDFCMVPPGVNTQLALLEREDPYMEGRASIVYAKQLANPRSRIRIMRAKWESR